MKAIAGSPHKMIRALVPIGAAFILVVSTVISPAQDDVVKRPKPKPTVTEESTRQGVVKRVVERTVRGGYQDYQRATRNTYLQPNYANPTNYQNPLLRKLEFGDMPTLCEAQNWLRNPAAPDRPASRPQDRSVPIDRSTP